MANIYHSLTELIGNTPLLELSRLTTLHPTQARLLAKLEMFNPGGSSKDRIALAMIEAAEKEGSLRPGATLIEPTSGNTGVGLAWVARVKGYQTILTMPDTMSRERQLLLKAMGARVVLTPGALGMKGAIAKAQELHAQLPGSLILRQFDNPANPAAHIHTTAQEIWKDTDGQIDIFVAGVGTGGTLSGVGRGLKAYRPTLQAIAVEPALSPILSGGTAGPHSLQGIGANFIPATYDATVVDEIIQVSEEDALRTARELVQTEGVLAGISSGAALYAAIQVAQRIENQGKTLVVLLPDTGERYLSTALFAEENQS